MGVKMSDTTFNISVDDNARIKLYTRYWDGIDHPHYTTIETVEIPRAGCLLKTLAECIETAKEFKGINDEKRIEKLEREIKNKKDELDSLIKKRGKQVSFRYYTL